MLQGKCNRGEVPCSSSQQQGQVGIKPPIQELGAQDPNHCTKLLFQSQVSPGWITQTNKTFLLLRIDAF